MNAKENGEKPASGFAHDLCGVSGGMTKRETIAMHLMAGLASCESGGPIGKDARIAVAAADALLAELAKETT